MSEQPPAREPAPEPPPEPPEPTSATEPTQPIQPYGAPVPPPSPYGAAPPPPAPVSPPPPPPYQQPYQQPPAYQQPGYGPAPYGAPGYGPAPYGPPGYGPPPGHPGYGLPPYGGYPQPPSTPGSSIALVVVSAIATFCCFGIPSLIIGIIALTKARTDLPETQRLTRIGWIVFGVLAGLALVLGIIGAISGGNDSPDGFDVTTMAPVWSRLT